MSPETQSSTHDLSARLEIKLICEVVSLTPGWLAIRYAIQLKLGAVKMKRILVLIAVLLIGCTKHEVQNKPDAENAINVEQSSVRRRTLTLADSQGVRSLSQVTHTGVKEDVLIAVMNHNTDPDSKFHHHFEFVGQNNGIRLYSDTRSPFSLLLRGPENDLILMTLMVRMEDFVVKTDDPKLAMPHAGALGRCIQRMAMAVDPSWSNELYEWCAKVMPHALFSQEGAEISHKPLAAFFGVIQLTKDQTTLNFTIHRPDE